VQKGDFLHKEAEFLTKIQRNDIITCIFAEFILNDIKAETSALADDAYKHDFSKKEEEYANI